MSPTTTTLTLIERRTALVLASEKQQFVMLEDNTAVDETNQANIRLALTKCGYEFGVDLFSGVIYITDSGENARPIVDEIIHRLWLEVDEKFHFRPTLELFTIIVMDFARQFAHHPVRDYLDELEWDGEKRLDTWLETYAGAEDTEFNRAVGALVLIAAVRRVRQPGCKFDELLVWQGNQGDGKSSAIKALVPHDKWFSDSLGLGDDAKVTIERSRGIWIAELSELVGNFREVERIKGFLSRHIDGPVRLAYGRLPVTVERQFIAIGSTNEAEFLRDVTGNRRFWPVATPSFDIPKLIRDRDQLWAEASEREAAGESIRLSEDLWATAAEVQEQFRQKHPWELLIDEKLDLENYKAVVMSALWTTVDAPEYMKHDQRNAKILDGVMRRAGFVSKKKIRIRGDGGASTSPKTCWVRDVLVTRLDAEDVLSGSWSSKVKSKKGKK